MAETTSTPPHAGMNQNTAACLAYLLGALSGLYFFLTEKTNKYIRFHALQSILLSVIAFVLGMIPVFGLLISMAWVVLTVVLMIKAYHGEKYKLPVLGDFAEKKV